MSYGLSTHAKKKVCHGWKRELWPINSLKLSVKIGVMKIKNKELAILIEEWFLSSKNKTKQKNFWNQNTVAKVIKDNINKLNHWKKQKKGYIDF